MVRPTARSLGLQVLSLPLTYLPLKPHALIFDRTVGAAATARARARCCPQQLEAASLAGSARCPAAVAAPYGGYYCLGGGERAGVSFFRGEALKATRAMGGSLRGPPRAETERLARLAASTKTLSGEPLSA